MTLNASRPLGRESHQAVNLAYCSCGQRYYSELEQARHEQDAWVPADGDRKCQRCHRPNPRWSAPSEDWNLVMGGPTAKDDPGGVLCPSCYHAAWLANQDARLRDSPTSSA